MKTRRLLTGMSLGLCGLMPGCDFGSSSSVSPGEPVLSLPAQLSVGGHQATLENNWAFRDCNTDTLTIHLESGSQDTRAEILVEGIRSRRTGSSCAARVRGSINGSAFSETSASIHFSRLQLSGTASCSGRVSGQARHELEAEPVPLSASFDSVRITGSSGTT